MLSIVIYIIVNYIQAWAYSKQAYINEVVPGSGKFSFLNLELISTDPNNKQIN